jgi:3-dehydroquinate synthase
MTNTIHTRNYSIHLLSELKSLEQLIPDRKYSQIFVLVDENTEQYCLPKLLDAWGGKAPKTIRIPSGENHKTLQSCSLIWEQLLKEGADRHSLLLNLGGGVIGDIGGFCASTYMRGMDFIQVPTTLLAQVDASIGGKLGIDFGEVKNSIGLFHEPLAIWVFPDFLQTLPQREWRSGFAEVIKHALIADADHWNLIEKTPDAWNKLAWTEVIKKSIQIKKEVVEKDPLESGRRKILNFGHTFGHALESWSWQNDRPLLHGEAVAAGMIMEAYLSNRASGLPINDLRRISSVIFRIFGKYEIPSGRFNHLLDLMRKDKKNKSGRIRFSLLKKVGKAIFDIECPEKELEAAVAFYSNFSSPSK